MADDHNNHQGNQYYQTPPPYYQNPPSYQGPPPQYYQGPVYYQAPPQIKKGNGLGSASLALGIIAIIGSWIPFLNVVSLILAVISLGLGIPGLILGIVKQRPKGVAIAGLILAILSVWIYTAMYAAIWL